MIPSLVKDYTFSLQTVYSLCWIGLPQIQVILHPKKQGWVWVEAVIYDWGKCF
jgi:hypothetical protein